MYNSPKALFRLHKVAQRCLLPPPAFSVEVVPLDELIHIV